MQPARKHNMELGCVLSVSVVLLLPQNLQPLCQIEAGIDPGDGVGEKMAKMAAERGVARGCLLFKPIER